MNNWVALDSDVGSPDSAAKGVACGSCATVRSNDAQSISIGVHVALTGTVTELCM